MLHEGLSDRLQIKAVQAGDGRRKNNRQLPSSKIGRRSSTVSFKCHLRWVSPALGYGRADFPAIRN
jgi:hypothetical protein